jgi:PTS system N-acetylglucosamine-specific IIA component
LSDVPDPVFAEAMVGPGAAVDPPRRVLDAVSPVDGTLVKVHPHAFVVQADDGVAVLVHLGIDTVRLEGAHFTVRAEAGAHLTAGDVVTTWDVAAVEAEGLNPIVPVIALEQPAEAVVVADVVTAAGDEAAVEAGDPLFTVLLTVGTPVTD